MAVGLFEAVKQAVTTKAAAERYGLEVHRHGMAICPFHDDGSPSLKLNDEYYHCFGCGASGDVIDFVARLFQISNLEAAKKLASDFGIAYDSTLSASTPTHRSASVSKQIALQRENYTFRILNQYFHKLQEWQVRYDPKSPQESIDPRFLEAVRQKEYIEYLLDVLITGTAEEKAAICTERNPDIRRIAHRLSELEKVTKAKDLER